MKEGEEMNEAYYHRDEGYERKCGGIRKQAQSFFHLLYLPYTNTLYSCHGMDVFFQNRSGGKK